jgi:hypothetical protein
MWDSGEWALGKAGLSSSLSDMLPGSPPLDVLSPKLHPDQNMRREVVQSTLGKENYYSPLFTTTQPDISDY